MYNIFIIDCYHITPEIRTLVRCETLDAVNSSLNTLFTNLQVQWHNDESEDLFVQRVIDGVTMNLEDFDDTFIRQYIQVKWID